MKRSGLRPAWQDTVSDAADLALLGIVAFVASLPIVTAGAAVSAASQAVHDRHALGSLPSWRTSLGRFVRGLVPGLGATVVTLAVVALIVIDVRGLARGVVPGGGPALALTVTVIALIIGYAGLTVVAVGTGTGWRAAIRAAGALAWQRPGALVAAGGIGVIAVLLAVAIPVTLPLVFAGWLHALHAVSALLAARSPRPSSGRS
ncbi:MAG: hypothetical protein HOV78_23890 [Hamadaea sp.]|nr:hypothetical protein [Hamadaea sp.]